MEKGKTTVECIRRKGMQDLYVAGVGGVSQAFYDLDELSEWLAEKGVPFEDPAWDYIEQLVEQQD